MKRILINEKFEELLLANWASVLDTTQLMRIVLEHARSNEFPCITQEEIAPRNTKIMITRFRPEGNKFSVWAEFTVPKEEGVVIGTHTFSMTLNGELSLEESFGTFFLPKS